jgi:copper resistance protein B
VTRIARLCAAILAHLWEGLRPRCRSRRASGLKPLPQSGLALVLLLASGMGFAQHEGHEMHETHEAHEAHEAHERGDLPADAAPRTPIPVPTEADRIAAFPPTQGHAAHDQGIHSYALVDRLEWQDADGGALAWETVGWLGGDLHRAWLRTEGESEDGDVGAEFELLYGRAVLPWWDLVAGVRHDVGDGPARSWAAIGVQGLAPMKFEVEATLYAGSAGRTAATLEAEYDTLLTNRWILQWLGEARLFGKDDPEAGVGSGLSSLEFGARLRYEVTRRFAPYIGIVHERSYGDTADHRREHGEPARDTRLVAGVRFWF